MARRKAAPERFGVCPYVTAQWLLQGKWTIVLLHCLSEGTKRFGELQHMMPELTHSTLSSQLKQLEDEGLVRREAFAEVPPRVEYSLTELGRSFGPVLDDVEAWGQHYIDCLHARDAGQNDAGEKDGATA